MTSKSRLELTALQQQQGMYHDKPVSSKVNKTDKSTEKQRTQDIKYTKEFKDSAC